MSMLTLSRPASCAGVRLRYHPMLRALHTGNVRYQDRPILAGVQVTPLPRTVVIALADRTALRAGQLVAGVMGHVDLDDLLLVADVHVRERRQNS